MTEPIDALLPTPKQITRTQGTCPIPSMSVHDLTGDERISKALTPWSMIANDRPGAKPLRVAVDKTVATDQDAYTLHVKSDGITITGTSPAGCFYGIMTLNQMTGRCICDASEPAQPPPRVDRLPCCLIQDAPDFALRGLLHDVTRGKVPTAGTLKTLIDRLAAMKINQLQLNIEHAFVFTFDPQICSEAEGLTPDEIRDVDQYARDRFVDLVPALATFGHMGRILSMPRYRALAEKKADREFAEMNWHDRMRGQTLNCMDPQAHDLVRRMWHDVLEAFSSPVVNICGDEPWDMGQGKSAADVERLGKGRAYLEQIRRTHACCSAQGRSVQFWSDIIRSYPELLSALPSDITVLHWGYDDNADYEGLSVFAKAGLPAVACPGTTGWKRIINAMDLAERNIATFANAGKKHGVVGLLNTDWGDHGHFNLLACSWHGIALGAAFGWSADHPTGDAFDRRFAAHFLPPATVDLIRHLRGTSHAADTCETWRLLWQPVASIAEDRSIPDADTLEEMRHHADTAGTLCEGIGAPHPAAATDLDELATACLFVDLFVEKMLTMRKGQTAADNYRPRMKRALQRYTSCWNRRNKPAGLLDIRRVLLPDAT